MGFFFLGGGYRPPFKRVQKRSSQGIPAGLIAIAPAGGCVVAEKGTSGLLLSRDPSRQP